MATKLSFHVCIPVTEYSPAQGSIALRPLGVQFKDIKSFRTVSLGLLTGCTGPRVHQRLYRVVPSKYVAGHLSPPTSLELSSSLSAILFSDKVSRHELLGLLSDRGWCETTLLLLGVWGAIHGELS